MRVLKQGTKMKIVLLSLSPDIALYSLTFLSAANLASAVVAFLALLTLT
jgi:hypothetical protein